jgi:hypothetical protein
MLKTLALPGKCALLVLAFLGWFVYEICEGMGGRNFKSRDVDTNKVKRSTRFDGDTLSEANLLLRWHRAK